MRPFKINIFLFLFCVSCKVYSGEGMWLPLLIKALNEKEMKAMGMKISAEDIYSINKGSLKDAIVHFGGGCTAEIISDQGLLLTNHHCGYGYIQSHTTLENNYIKDGFWADAKNLELACPGLTATIIVRMEEVTAKVLDGVDVNWNENQRRNKIEANIEKLKPNISKLNDQDVFIRAFYNGNQYFAFVTEVFRDVRLVGTPPESIGKFGADTDNWVWPRHTGDFSLFRIYANKENRPADYAKDNIAYKPKHFLPISMSGVQEGDFTMVFGFPGRTSEYLIHEGVRQQVEVLNPVRIALRDKTLKILDKYMRANPKTKIQYSSKYAGIANAWKKWIGENQGIKTTRGLDKKLQADQHFQSRVNANPLWSDYKNLISDLEFQYKRLEPFTFAREYYAESFNRNIDLVDFYQLQRHLIDVYEGRGAEAFGKARNELIDNADGYFKDFDPAIDQEIFATLLEQFYKEMNPAFVFNYLKEEIRNNGNDTKEFAAKLYSSSILINRDSFAAILKLDYSAWLNRVKSDVLWKFYDEMNYYLANDIHKQCSEFEDRIMELRRKHMAALIEVIPEKKYYPDANSTLRITYGKVEGYKPRDGVHYLSRTTLDGVMEKYIPGDYEFDVPKRLQYLYKNKDYGIYGQDGRMPLAFIGSNHTTGGNSGSPAIDAHGNLIGLNFDRVWEGTMSDINYDSGICRNIMVDVRYILFIIDKFANAPWLVQEMKLVYPKGKKK